MAIEPKLVWQRDCQLGEAPVWLAEEAALRFVDIKRGQLHRFDPATGNGTSLDVGGNPSFIVPIDDGGCWSDRSMGCTGWKAIGWARRC